MMLNQMSNNATAREIAKIHDLNIDIDRVKRNDELEVLEVISKWPRESTRNIYSKFKWKSWWGKIGWNKI